MFFIVSNSQTTLVRRMYADIMVCVCFTYLLTYQQPHRNSCTFLQFSFSCSLAPETYLTSRNLQLATCAFKGSQLLILNDENGMTMGI